MSEKKESEQIVKDDELDELLESALDDFDKDPVSDKTFEDPPMETLWNDEFISQQAKIFESQMAAIFGASDGGAQVTSDQIQLGFSRIAEAAAIAVDNTSNTVIPSEVDPSLCQSIKEVLKGLSEGQQNLQQPFSTDDIAGIFGNINLNESGANNAFLPFMKGMMESLLSAEVLLPSLKELSSKYPSWLADNASKISSEEKERYESQLKLMQEVCGELEKEKMEDSAEIKKQRFNVVLDRMQKMQELGQPPSEILGEGVEQAVPNLPINTEGINGEQCSVM